jgi:uncharacterized protein
MPPRAASLERVTPHWGYSEGMSLNPTELVWLVVLGLASGTLGSIAGVGGGVIIVPVLVSIFGFDFPTAVAASLGAVVATSIAAGSAYVGGGFTNMRLAMTLDVATTLGGITGGFLGIVVAERLLAGVFAVSMSATSILVARYRPRQSPDPMLEHAHRLPTQSKATRGGQLDARYRDPDTGLKVTYQVRRVPVGFGVSYGAGIMSGLLGIGGGFITVPAMNLIMGVPLRVAAATSNFMVGVTAVAGLFVYLGRGEVHPPIVTPLVLGTIVGALVGSTFSTRLPSDRVRRILTVILVFVAAQMGLRALGVSLG